MNSDRIDRVSSNLKKLSAFLAVVGIALLYAGWIALPQETVSTGLWIVRIGGVLVIYAAAKDFAIEKYLKAGLE